MPLGSAEYAVDHLQMPVKTLLRSWYSGTCLQFQPVRGRRHVSSRPARAIYWDSISIKNKNYKNPSHSCHWSPGLPSSYTTHVISPTGQWAEQSSQVLKHIQLNGRAAYLPDHTAGFFRVQCVTEESPGQKYRGMMWNVSQGQHHTIHILMRVENMCVYEKERSRSSQACCQSQQASPAPTLHTSSPQPPCWCTQSLLLQPTILSTDFVII